ncbi:MAG: hypothetical protein ACYSYL_13450 [Planctomycetota bacterium]
MRLYPKIGQDAGRNRALFTVVVLIFCGNALASEHRDRGYMYLSPVPRAEYVLLATDFILVRFETVNPNDIDNLDSFITVTGASSGNHPAQWTRIASDGRTVIFRISGDFSINELVTVDLNPAKDPGASGTIDPYSYEFMTSGPMPAPPPSPPPPPPGSESPAGGQVLNAQVAPETEWEVSTRDRAPRFQGPAKRHHYLDQFPGLRSELQLSSFIRCGERLRHGQPRVKGSGERSLSAFRCTRPVCGYDTVCVPPPRK